ncbi:MULTISPECIES: sugar ABC transporter ATP-binding protein [unclassified Serratia (in: enterobacteria)]|uniref:sugar ABC transporter ATP-binding protein n=1 Tax=unclassified Serratia (in: enterobacteria) TaxID=2647522 RepID=UPI00046AAA1E|nr:MULTISPECIES: sugar ABC transporter ATP-binding protein [unclassified Serratia (in: enterobacteria)]
MNYQAQQIKIAFTGVQVLHGVDFCVKPGEIHGLFGHNGAGKSTLLKILAGVNAHDSGELLLGDRVIRLSSPRDALNQGIACVYQELRLIPGMSVWQNLFLGRELRNKGFLDEVTMRQHTTQVIDEYGLSFHASDLVRDLSHPDKQMLEVIANLDRDARFLFLDEPTTALEGSQAEELLHAVQRIAREKNIGVVLVSHKLDEVLGVCDRATVMCGGKVIYHADKLTLSKAAIVDAIVGDAAVYQASSAKRTAPTESQPVFLSVKHLATSRLKDINLTARQGEILGIYGLAGAGRTRFCRTLYGLETLTGGEVELNGQTYRPSTPAHAIKHHIAYLTEERKKDGFIPNMSSFANATLPILQRFRTLGWVNHHQAESSALAILNRMNTRGTLSGPIKSLSGGNQQKVLFARVIGQNAELVLLDEPTKGVDIGAKADIYKIIYQLAEAGCCVLMVSSEEEELLEVADNIVVFRQGSCDGVTLSASALTPAHLRKAAWSHEEATA